MLSKVLSRLPELLKFIIVRIFTSRKLATCVNWDFPFLFADRECRYSLLNCMWREFTSGTDPIFHMNGFPSLHFPVVASSTLLLTDRPGAASYSPVCIAS